MKLDLVDNRFMDGFVSIFESPVFKPLIVWGFIVVLSIRLPETIVFDDESVLHLRQILLYGATFFLVGWMMGNWGKR